MAQRRRNLGQSAVLAASALAVTALALAACPDDVTLRNAPPPGELRSFDPIATFGEVSGFAGSGAELLDMRARFVRGDGTLDLQADYEPSVTYRFVVARTGADGEAAAARPVGAGGGATRELTVMVKGPGYYHYQRSGGGYNVNTRVSHDGMLAIPGETPRAKELNRLVPAPTCAFADLWKQARAEGAPEGAVAVIAYDRRGYDFRVDGTDFRAHFDFACKPGKERRPKKKDR